MRGESTTYTAYLYVTTDDGLDPITTTITATPDRDPDSVWYDLDLEVEGYDWVLDERLFEQDWDAWDQYVSFIPTDEGLRFLALVEDHERGLVGHEENEA